MIEQERASEERTIGVQASQKLGYICRGLSSEWIVELNYINVPSKQQLPFRCQASYSQIIHLKGISGLSVFTLKNTNREAGLETLTALDNLAS